MRRTKYSAEVLAPIVSTSTSYTEVMRRLGLQPTGGNYRHIAACIRRACLSIDHFTYGKGIEKIAPVDGEVLAVLVSTSTSVAQVAAKLGIMQHGRPHRQLSLRIKQLGIDTLHFKGPGWARGESKLTHPSVASMSIRRSLPDSEVFIENGPSIGGARLTQRLLSLGWAYRCAWCGIVEWRGVELTLHVDHINGVNNDNRLENLRFLCPNCHSQTDTYCNRAREESACYMLSTNASVLEW